MTEILDTYTRSIQQITEQDSKARYALGQNFKMETIDGEMCYDTNGNSAQQSPSPPAQPEWIGANPRPRVLESKTVTVEFDKTGCSEAVIKNNYFEPHELKLRAVLTDDYDIAIEFSTHRDAMRGDAWFPETHTKNCGDKYFGEAISKEIDLFVQAFFKVAVLNQYSPEWANYSRNNSSSMEPAAGMEPTAKITNCN